MALKKVLMWPDTHVPYQHKRACKIVIRAALDMGIDALYLLGDFADFLALSMHGPRDPRILTALKQEVEEVNLALDAFDRLFPDIPKTYIQGNHEYRFERYIQNKCPELFGITDCQHLFGLHRRPGWKWVSYGPHQKTQVLNSKLWARHEPLASSGKATASKAMCSLIHGHDHQIHRIHSTSMGGDEHIIIGCGWLGDRHKDEVFGYVKNHQNWQLGFTVVYVDDETGAFYPHTYHIPDARGKLSCVVDGKRYEE